MPDRIEELFAELAESVSGFGDELTQQGRIGREYEDLEKERLVEGLYKNDPAVLAALGTLATLPVSLPVQAPAWLTRAGIASKVPGLNKSYGAVGGDMVSQTLKAIEQVTGRSGARVGTDVAGRVPLPTAKPSVITKQGPRGPTNIDSPNQMPLPLSGGRNTGGISATERAQLPNPYRVRESSRLQSPRDPYHPIGAKNVPEGLTRAGTNRGRPYPGPHLTAEEGLKKLVPLRITGKAKEATWYQHPRTGDLYQYHYGTGALARGFYRRGKDAGGTPQYAP